MSYTKEQRQENLKKARERRQELSKEGKLHRETKKQKEFRDQIEADLRKKLTDKIEKNWEMIINSLLKRCKDQKIKEKGVIKRINEADLRAIIFAIEQGAGKATELTKLNLNKGNIKGLENDLRGWAGVRDSIEKMPLPEKEVSEVGDDPDIAL